MVGNIPLIVIDVAVLCWRIRRRYHLIQINHIIAELQYIADDHFAHKIPFKVNDKVQGIINNVNVLVNNVIESIHKRKLMEKSKNDLITNVSHDIRTPLTSIIGYLGLIESKRYNLSQNLKFANVAFFKAKQMKNLANELFEYTKISRNRVPMNYHQINIHQMLEQLAIGNQLQAKKLGVKITIQDQQPRLKIDADAAKIGRALNDLIANALKYGHDGKKIILAFRLINSQEVMITVTNDGKKIPKSSLQFIFSRFYRVEKSRNHHTGGSGLGLAIVANIIRLHHGIIRVKSNRVRTKFIIYLPIHQINRNSNLQTEKMKSND